jgi:hypothetical protein
MPPLIIFKTTKNLPVALYTRFQGRALIRSNRTGWMDTKLMNEYIRKIYDNTIYPSDTVKALLLDQFSGHKTEKILNLYSNLGLKVYFIPSGCTSLIQPLDTDINKPFKDRMRAKFSTWLSDFGSNLTLNGTRGGRLRAPDLETIVSWILQSISEFPPGMISRAFKHCGEKSLIAFSNALNRLYNQP